MKPTYSKSIALIAFALVASLASAAHADSSLTAEPIRSSDMAQHDWSDQVPLRPDDDVIYDNGRPPRVGGGGFDTTEFIEADDFRVSSDATLTGVFFWDFEDSLGYQGEIDWILYADGRGRPGAVLASGAAIGEQVTRILLRSSHFDQYTNSFSISPGVSLSAGTTYWLGLHNGPLSYTSPANFFWQTTRRNKTSNASYNEAPFFDNRWKVYDDNNQQFAFYLSGTIGQ